MLCERKNACVGLNVTFKDVPRNRQTQEGITDQNANNEAVSVVKAALSTQQEAFVASAL